MTVIGYSEKQIWLHWIIAILIVTQFVLHDGIVAVSTQIERGQSAASTLMSQSHVIFGLLIFVLALSRVYLRLTRGVPAAPTDEPAVLRFLASATHMALYAVMLIMPISGSLAWFGGLEIAKAGHNFGKMVMVAFVLLHVAGAIYQHFFLKTDAVRRMIRAET